MLQFREVFDRFDTDGTGTISKAELKLAVKQSLFNRKAKDLDVDALIAEFDKDGNGNEQLRQVRHTTEYGFTNVFSLLRVGTSSKGAHSHA